MANTIQLKRGNGTSEPSSLAEGELAINLDSGKLFYGSGSSVLSDFTVNKLTAETYVVSSSVTHMTTSFSSGSTAFGDSAGDTHTFTGPITASGNISSSGNVYAADYFDNGANISTIYSPIAGGSGIVTVGTLGSLTVTGNITANGNIVGDDGTNITNIVEVQCDAIAADANTTTKILIGDTSIDFAVDDNDVFEVSANQFIASVPATFTGDITASGNISSSGNVYAADYFDDGANISTIYSPIAGHGNIVTVGTITTGTWNAGIIAEGKLQNQSGTNTGDEDLASINALDITEVGALGSGTIASGFGNIDNGTSTLDTGALTATTLTVPSRVFADPGTSAGDHTAGDVWYFGDVTTNAGAIYFLNASGTWSKANADAVLDGTGMLAVALGGNSTTNGMLLRGFVTLVTDIDGTEDHGVKVYLKATDGLATVTAPTTSGHIVRIIGYSIHNSDDAIYFSPDNTWVEIA